MHKLEKVRRGFIAPPTNPFAEVQTRVLYVR